MSENTQNAEHTQTGAEEAPIVVQIEGDKPKPLTIDLEVMTVKQLSEFQRSDLLALCEEKNLLKGIKEYKKGRLNRGDLAKLLKSSTETKQEEKTEDISTPESEEVFAVETANLQKGINQLFEGKEPTHLDAFASDVISKSQYAVISPETVQKMEKYIYFGSLGWLGYRKFFGTFARLKAFFVMLKAKLNKKKVKVDA